MQSLINHRNCQKYDESRHHAFNRLFRLRSGFSLRTVPSRRRPLSVCFCDIALWDPDRFASRSRRSSYIKSRCRILKSSNSKDWDLENIWRPVISSYKPGVFPLRNWCKFTKQFSKRLPVYSMASAVLIYSFTTVLIRYRVFFIGVISNVTGVTTADSALKAILHGWPDLPRLKVEDVFMRHPI